MPYQFPPKPFNHYASLDYRIFDAFLLLRLIGMAHDTEQLRYWIAEAEKDEGMESKPYWDAVRQVLNNISK